MADQPNRYVMLFEGGGERWPCTAEYVRKIGGTDMASWMNFLRLIAGAPSALMTLHDKEGQTVRFLLVREADCGNMTTFDNPPS